MKVSVIIPTYNRAYCLGKAIESVLAQTYTDFELLVVDDGSTDNTKEVVEQYIAKDNRVHFLSMDTNGGVAAARNYGMRAALGEYIAFQDSDDYWHQDKLEKQMKTMKENDADFSYTYIGYSIDGVRVCVIPSESIELSCMNGNVLPQILHENLVGAPTLVMHRRCYENIGEFDTSYMTLEDYDYAIRLAKEFKAAFVPEVLLTATFSEGSVSNTSTNYYIASCMLIAKYKKELIGHNQFNYKVQKLIEDAGKMGVTDKVVAILEKMLQG